jgi:hypothetical protein
VSSCKCVSSTFLNSSLISSPDKTFWNYIKKVYLPVIWIYFYCNFYFKYMTTGWTWWTWVCQGNMLLD